MKVQATVTHSCASSAESFFPAWLDPAQVRLWLAQSLRESGLEGNLRRVEIDARPDGHFFFSDLRSGIEARHWGRYLHFAPPERLTFTWITDESEEADPSTVTIAIAAGQLTLVHEMDAAWAGYLPRVEAAWTRMLKAIDAWASSNHPPA